MIMDETYKSPNFDTRAKPVDMILIHYTEMESAEEACEKICDASSKVSAHYLIDQDGKIFKLVPEDKRAWHAGVSVWNGESDQNSRSIGIELQNKGNESFPDAQIDALIALAKDIMTRYDVKYVLGHSDVALSRKVDPGELFPWKKLADAGICRYTEEFAQPTKLIQEMLANIGYDPTDMMAALSAFRNHFHQECCADPKEGSKTAERLAAVEKLFDGMQ